MKALGYAALRRGHLALVGTVDLIRRGVLPASVQIKRALTYAALRRGRLALVGAVSLIGLGLLPGSAPSNQYTERSLSPAAIRVGFVKMMPDPVPVAVTGARAGTGMSRRHKAAQTITKVSADQQRCLAEALYYEARGEGTAGQMAVAEVVIRRSKTRGYPGSICGVVYQGNPGGTTGCQFSFACNGAMARAREPGAWSRARRMAQRIGTGKVALAGLTGNALFFHATSVRPHWPGLVRTAQIGSHVFYRAIPDGGAWAGLGGGFARARCRAMRRRTTRRRRAASCCRVGGSKRLCRSQTRRRHST